MKAPEWETRPLRLPALTSWLTVGAATGAAALVWVLAGVPVEVKRVKVSGVRHLSPAQVERIAGIKTGTRVGRKEARGVRNTLESHEAILKASVSAGVTGTLHIRVKERVPVAWLVRNSCALAEDGVPLRHVRDRDPSWVVITGLRAKRAEPVDPEMIQEAMAGERLMRGSGDEGGGAWHRSTGKSAVWLWLGNGKKILFSSPVPAEEVNRLRRFQRSCPKAWAGARYLDMRFADRVVVKR